MKQAQQVIFFLLMFCVTYATAQEPFYYDESTGEDFQITPQTEESKLNKYLAKNELEAIEFNPDSISQYAFRVKTNEGSWLLCDSWHLEMHGQEKYDLAFPNQELEALDYTVASRKDKKYFYSFSSEKIHDLWFEKVCQYRITDTVYFFDEAKQQTEQKLEHHLCFGLKRNGNWAMAYISNGGAELNGFSQLYQLTPFAYNNKSEMPRSALANLIRVQNDLRTKGLIEDDENTLRGIERLVADKKYTEIAFNTELYSPYLFKVKHKKGHWGLGTFSGNFIGWNGFSLGFPNEMGFAIATRDEKQYIVSLNEEEGIYKRVNTPWFSALTVKNRLDTMELMIYDEEGNTQVEEKVEVLYDKIILRRKDRFALAHYSRQKEKLYLLSGFHFNSADELPDSLLDKYNDYEFEYPRLRNSDFLESVNDYLISNSKIDIAFPIGYYKDTLNKVSKPILQFRHATTKRWSLDIPDGYLKSTDLPIAVNSIIRHNYFDENAVFEVWCDNNVGYYAYQNNDIKQILSCEYDAFKFVNLDYTYGCALKKGEMWKLYDVAKAEKMLEGSATDVDKLIDLWLSR